VTQEPPPQPSAGREKAPTDTAPKKETSAPKPVTSASRKPEPKRHHRVHHARARPHRPHERTKTAAERRRSTFEAHKPSPVKRAAVTAGASRSAGGGAERQGAASRYLAELQQAIARHRFYPREARRRGLEGEVAISFVIQADGRITDVRVARSSGSGSLDNAGLRTLEDLGRFQPIPEELGRSRWMLRVPITYALR
jgi:protein TonB